MTVAKNPGFCDDCGCRVMSVSVRCRPCFDKHRRANSRRGDGIQVAPPLPITAYSKERCRRILGQAVLCGSLRRPDRCEVCGVEETVDAHHEDYSRPLFVRWVCRACHKRLERNFQGWDRDSVSQGASV